MNRRFILSITTLIVLFFIFTFYNINQINREISEKQYIELLYELSEVTYDFDTWIGEKLTILETAKDVVNNFTYDEIIRWNTKNPYLNINNQDPDISQIYIGLKNGDFITGGQWIPPETYDPTTRVWYQKAVEADDIIVSDIYIDRETGDQTVTISAPLYLEGDFVGVISADVFLTNIYGYIEERMVNDQVYSYILDEEGLIILHTSRTDIIGQNLYEDIQDEIIIGYFEEAKKTNQSIRMEYVFRGDKLRGVMDKINGTDWYLVVAMISDNNLENLARLNSESMVFNLISMFGFLILIYIIFKIKRDMTNLNTHLKYDNEKDFLTSIYNRRYFNFYTDKLWKAENKDQTISLLMIDIDYFKEYNDTYGHIKGDEILKQVAGTISSIIRKGDVFARYGGEEFALILKDVAKDEALQIGNKIREAIYDLEVLHEKSKEKRLTISIGVTTVDLKDGLNISDVVNLADDALYKAKKKGRNRVEFK